MEQHGEINTQKVIGQVGLIGDAGTGFFSENAEEEFLAFSRDWRDGSQPFFVISRDPQKKFEE